MTRSSSELSNFRETSIQIRLYLLGEEAETEKFLNALKSDSGIPSKINDFDISVINDTCVVLITGTQKDGLAAWSKTEDEAVKCAKEELQNFPTLDFIGATVIYQAVFDNLLNGMETSSINELLNAEIAIDSEPFSQPIIGGSLALLHYPSMGELGQDSFQPRLRYLALCEADWEEELNRYLNHFSPRDIAILKAHWNIHNFRKLSSRDNLEQTLDEIDDYIKLLFKETDVLAEKTKTSLDELSVTLSALYRFYIEVHSRHTSMVQQRNIYQHSFDTEPQAVAMGQLWNSLRQRINTLNEELEIKISECQAVLQATQQAVDLVQTRIDQADEALEREQEQRLRRRDELLAYLGVAIALPELINYELVERLLTSWRIYFNPIGYFLVQLGLIVVIGGLIVWFIKKSSFRKPKIIDEAKSELDE